MVLIAGPNGSGKSTLTEAIRSEPQFAGLELFNPDEIGKDLRRRGAHALMNWAGLLWPTDWAAAKAVTRRVEDAIDARRSFIVETVLSSPKYLRQVNRARELGFYVAMVFVALPTADLNVLRVQTRVAQKGHGVPEKKIRSRWERSHEFLTQFAPLVDELRVFDNSRDGAPPRLVARKAKRHDEIELLSTGVLPRVERALDLSPM